MSSVDRSSPLPVYFQIALDVRRRIAAGEWTAGARIAPELELVRQYAVSRVTVRQALAELVKDDLLDRHRGSGTYVREQQHPLVYDLNLTVGVMATRLREPGRFNPWGTLVAVYFLITGITGLTILGVESYVQDLFYGGALVLAVALSHFPRRKELREAEAT